MNMAITLCLILFLDYRPFFEELYIEFTKKEASQHESFFEEQTLMKRFFNESISKCRFRLEMKTPSQLYFFYLNTKFAESK